MTGEKSEGLVVMAKPVGSRCNMRCRYCYYLGKGRYSAHAKQTVMSADLLEKLIREAAASSAGPVSFIWHGGEPTLAGIGFYKKVVELEKRLIPKGREVWNNLQTNGLLLNDEWCRFLKENRFDVGISIDGSELIHDRNRLTIAGEPTHRRVLAAIARLRRHGGDPDLLCTVNASSLKDPAGVYRALRDTGCTWIQFIPIVIRRGDGTLSPLSADPAGYGEFLVSVFDEWVKNDLGKCDVQLLAETARILAGGEASLCTMRKTCGRVLIAEEDGAVYSCDHFVDDGHRLGNLRSGKLAGMAESEFQKRFGERKESALTSECRACPWLRFCGGGCPKDRFGKSAEGEAGQYILCEGLKRFFSHAVPVLEQIMKESAAGRSPAEIMREIGTRPFPEPDSLLPSSPDSV